jgi:putative flippase GtrA
MPHSRTYRGPLQFAKFSLIGLLNGAIDLAALNALLLLVPSRTATALLLVNSIAYALAVLNSYFWNSKLTFRRHASFTHREKIKFVAQAAASLLISNVVFVVSVYMLGLSPLPLWLVHNGAKALSMAISSFSSFLFMKYYVFRR